MLSLASAVSARKTILSLPLVGHLPVPDIMIVLSGKVFLKIESWTLSLTLMGVVFALVGCISQTIATVPGKSAATWKMVPAAQVSILAISTT